MKWGSRAVALHGLVLAMGVVLVAAGAYASSAPAATRAKRERLTVVWPETGFPGYKLVISGEASGWGRGAVLALEHREPGGWHRVAHVRPSRTGGFVVTWSAPKAIGPISMRLVVVYRSRFVAQRSATLRIRPLPIVIPANEISSAPLPGHAGWIRFTPSHGRRARAASNPAGCLRVPTGPTVLHNNFVAVPYGPNSPDGYLGKILNFKQCGALGGLYATPASLDQAVSSGSIDLASGFVQKAGASLGTRKAFNWPIGQLPCSTGASATLSGNVALGIVPTLKVAFSSLGISSALFKIDATASATVGFDVKANAQCTLPTTSLLTGYPNGVPIATFEGSIGPFPVVIELRGQLDLSGSVKASADASDQVTATADVAGGIQYANGRFSPLLTHGFTVTDSGLSAGGTADAFATLTPEIQALFYGVAGPEVDLHAGVQLHADTAARPWCSLTAPVAVDAVFDALGRTSNPLNIYQQSFAMPIAACNGPFGGHPTPTVTITNPGNQASTTSSNVSLPPQTDRPADSIPTVPEALWVEPMGDDGQILPAPDGSIITTKCSFHNNTDADVPYAFQQLGFDGSLTWRRPSDGADCLANIRDASGNDYAFVTDSVGAHIESVNAGGMVRWLSAPLGNNIDRVYYATPALGTNGDVYFAVYNSFGDGYLAGVNEVTGAVTLDTSSAGGFPLFLGAYKSGLVVVNGSTVEYVGYDGTVTDSFASPVDAPCGAEALGANGTVFIGGAPAGTDCGSMYKYEVAEITPSGVQWTWQDSAANAACNNSQIAATPDGGVVVDETQATPSGNTCSATGAVVYSINSSGQVRWYQTLSTTTSTFAGSPLVDTNGVVAIPTFASYPCTINAGNTCTEMQILFASQTSSAQSLPTITASDESASSLGSWGPYVAIGPNRVYVDAAPYLDNTTYPADGDGLAALAATGLGEDYRLTLGQN